MGLKAIMNKSKEIKKIPHDVTGRIFDIQFFCVHDGPGIRTTVFFKGCPLNCLWCHNPEGISRKIHLSYSENKCIGCGACATVCDVHEMSGGKHIVHRSRCTLRGRCVAVCPTGALSFVGRDVTVDEVIAEVLRDRKYYGPSGGGMTLSGGEPAMQPEFMLALAMAAKSEGINVAVETSGYAPFGVYESVLQYVDMFLYDVKETDPELHRRFTNVNNKLPMENLRKLYEAGASILLRCPIIPGLNDRDDHFEAIANLTKEMPDLLGAELLPYHKLAASKSGRMGLAVQEEFEPPSPHLKAEWNEKLKSYGAKVFEA